MTVQIVDTVYGRMILPDTDHPQYTMLKSTGEALETDCIRYVQNLIGEMRQGTVIDGGACFGTWTLALAPLARDVVAFEPQPEIYDMLRGTIALNRLSRKVQVQRVALWSGYRRFEVPALDIDHKNNFGGSSLGHPLSALTLKFLDGVTDVVRGYPLDSLVTSSHVSFIKFDLEGSEIEALIGARQIIKRDRPIMLVEWQCSDQRDLARFIESMGYTVQDMGADFLCLPLKGDA